MGQPRNVKKQANEAKKLQEALNSDIATATPIEEPAEELEQKTATEIAAEEKQNLAQADIPAKSEELKAGDSDWEKRYKGLQLRYNREVPELRGKLSTTEDTIISLRKEINDVKDSIQTVETPAPAKDLEFSDEEREQYGDGWIEMMKKVAEGSHGELVRQVADLQNQLANVKQGVTQVRETVVVNTERDFFAALNSMVKAKTGKDWKSINEEDNFHNFLAEEVPYTGRERQEYLAEARGNLDVDSAAKFFIDYAGSISSKTEPEPIAPEVPEELITPEVSGGNIPPIKEEKVYTTSEIDQFYSDKRKGKYKGNEKEARIIEQDILAAGNSGRIVTKRSYAQA